jgi:Icc-related predicted phosphoesterase
MSPADSKSVRVVAMSDLHGYLPAVEDIPTSAQLLLIGGDVCPLQDHSPSAQYLWLRNEFAPWLEELQARGTVVAGVAGNHDFIFAADVDADVQVPMLNWTYLQDSEAEPCRLRVYGTPWIPHMGGSWVFQAPKSFGGDFLANRFGAIPEDIDVVISHGPPYGLRDVELGGGHIGSRALTTTLKRVQPRLLVCGHVHEGFGVSELVGDGWRTMVANVSILNWDYQASHRAMLFDVPLDGGPARPVRK